MKFNQNTIICHIQKNVIWKCLLQNVSYIVLVSTCYHSQNMMIKMIVVSIFSVYPGWSRQFRFARLSGSSQNCQVRILSPCQGDNRGLYFQTNLSTLGSFTIRTGTLNTLKPRQNGRHFPDDIFKCIFFNENVWRFHWNVFLLRFELTIFQHWFR